MTSRTVAATLASALTIAGCGTRQLPTATVAPLFGPAVSGDTISGYVDDPVGPLLMVGGTTLVRIDLESRSDEQTKVQPIGRERLWGLARLSDGSLWSLKGRNAAIELARDGRIVREVPLPTPHLGLFAIDDRLVFQHAVLPPNTPALFSGTPGGSSIPWSAMTTRPFAALATGAAAALNLVACGTTSRAEMPCWFPDEPAVWLITKGGESRRIELEGLPRASPEVLINASAPQRPIRDVHVERDGTIWVLSTGTPSASAKELPGGWLMARYGPHGEPIDRRLLPQPARLILRAGSGRALVLTGAGMVAEVRP